MSAETLTIVGYVVGLLGVLIAAGASVIVAVINLRQNRKIEEIHVLVNDRMDAALAEIESLKERLALAQAAAVEVITDGAGGP